MSGILPHNFRELIQNNKENVILIWFESTINISDAFQKTKETLQTIHNLILANDNIDAFIDDIMSVKRRTKIFLILSDNDGFKLLPSIHSLYQLDSVFIFSENQNEYNYSFDKFNKIVNIFNNQDELLTSVKDNLNDAKKQIELFSFYDQHQQATRDLSEESAKFLWFQLFNDVILHLPSDSNAKEEMLNVCRQYYRDRRKFRNEIDKFDESYCADECIVWYTSDTFLYKMINKALRTEDIDQLYTFRYFIADLSKKLADEYQTMKNTLKKIKLYRGTTTSKEEAKKFKDNEDKLIATNAYWSTSRSRLCASFYIGKNVSDTDTIPVLFEIECDFQDEQDSAIFADISRYSQFPIEQEVLFDIGAVFRILKVSEEKMDDADVLLVQIRTTGEGRTIAKKFIEENRKEMEDESPTIMLCKLLKRMGKFEKSLHFLERLLKNPGNENIAHIHNRIGIALKDECKYELALSHFEQAFKLTFYSDPPQRRYAAFVLHNKGSVHAKRKQFKKALSFYQQAKRVLEEEIGADNCGVAQFYNSIGRVYLHQKLYYEALDCQLKALDMRRTCLPPNHVVIAFSYADIAKIYLHEEKYDEALHYHRQALDLRKEYLPPDHHNIAWSLHQVGRIYYKMHYPRQARNYYFESLEIKRKCQSVSLYNSIVWILEDLAMTYNINSEEARDYRLEALEIQRKVEPIDYSILIDRHDQLAFTYKSMNNLNDSIKYYEEALEIQRKIQPTDYSILAYRLDQLAYIYISMNKLNTSLKYYEEALEIRKKYLYDNQRNVACSFKNLAYVYENMPNNTRALHYYKKALNICHSGYSHDHNFCKKMQRNIARVERSASKQ